MLFLLDFSTILQFLIGFILAIFLLLYFLLNDRDTEDATALKPISKRLSIFSSSSLQSTISSSTDSLILDLPLPPGPHQLTPEQVNDSKVYRLLTSLWETYGDIYSFKVEGSFIVVVNGLESINEVLIKQGDSFASRPVLPREIQYNPRQLGIYTAPYSQSWKTQREFLVTSLYKMGSAGPRLEREILYECQCLIQALNDTKENVIDLDAFIPLAVGNIIHFTLFGTRKNYDSETYLTLFDDLYDYFEGPDVTDANVDEESVVEVVNKIETYIQNEINDHKKNFDRDRPRDFLDLYLIEIEKNSKDPYTDFNEEQLRIVLFELLTTSILPLINTLKWIMLFMTNNYDIQENVQAEIDKVLGADRFPNMVDRNNLPYTYATMTECQRLASVTALITPRKPINNHRDTELKQFRIPPDAEIWINMWSISMDPKRWPEPHLLRPSRFLDNRGRYVRRDEFMPYSAGSRMCPARKSANMQIFLIFTHLLQYFRFERPGGVEFYPEDGNFSDVLSAPDFTVQVLKR